MNANIGNIINALGADLNASVTIRFDGCGHAIASFRSGRIAQTISVEIEDDGDDASSGRAMVEAIHVLNSSVQ